MSAQRVKKTITLPLDLVEELKAASANLSSFVAQACREKLQADRRKAIEEQMIERCQVRYGEDRAQAEEFFEAEQEVWDAGE